MKKYRIDKTKNIGNVIFVVEGGKKDYGGTELRILKRIFADILGYSVQELRRGSDEFIGYGNNPQFHVFALNLPYNQLTELTEDAIDKLFSRLKKEFRIKPEDCPVFFLYDRDVNSYHKNELRGAYVKKYTDPYATENGDQGQLLLSYPSIESFLISCIKQDTFGLSAKLGKEAKKILIEELCQSDLKNIIEANQTIVEHIIQKDIINGEKTIVNSIEEMERGLEQLEIDEYDLDNLAPTLLKVYDCQQSLYKEVGRFSFLSLVGMALLELGIIIQIDETVV